MKKIILGCVSFLIAVHILFSFPAPMKCLEAVWSAGDFISFVGTVALGVVAVNQTKDANDMSKRLMRIEEERHKSETQPFVLITSWEISSKKIYSSFLNTRDKNSGKIIDTFIGVCQGAPDISLYGNICFELTMTNTTKAYLSLTCDGVFFLDSPEKINWGIIYMETKNEPMVIPPNESKKIVFFDESGNKVYHMLKDRKIQFIFTLENRFGEKYKENIDCKIITKQESSGTSYITVESFDYHIEKSS